MDCITIEGGRCGTLAAASPTFHETPDDSHAPVWILCDVLLACGMELVGGVRLTPPRPGAGYAPHTRPTSIVANLGDTTVDILSGNERARASLLAHEVLPLRIRLTAPSPIPVKGLCADSPNRELGPGEWSRPLSPADMCTDLAQLAPLGRRARVNRM